MEYSIWKEVRLRIAVNRPKQTDLYSYSLQYQRSPIINDFHPIYCLNCSIGRFGLSETLKTLLEAARLQLAVTDVDLNDQTTWPFPTPTTALSPFWIHTAGIPFGNSHSITDICIRSESFQRYAALCLASPPADSVNLFGNNIVLKYWLWIVGALSHRVYL